MKQSFAIAALVGVSMGRNLLGGIGGNTADSDFIRYLGTMNKGYNTTDEFKLRKQIYTKNDDIINKKNGEAKRRVNRPVRFDRFFQNQSRLQFDQ